MEKPTKINAAILDTTLRLKRNEEEIMLLLKEKSVLQDQLRMMEILDDNKDDRYV